VSSKPLNVTQKYAKLLVEAVENEVAFGRYRIAEKMLHQFFIERVDEFEKEIDAILPSTASAANVAEVKARSGKKNMRVPD
jgi:hypothetical protein